MKITKLVEQTFWYCNWCGKELHCPYSISKGEDGIERHFHSEYDEGKKTCMDKWEEAMIARERIRRLKEANKHGNK